jgi:hypothetical protein
MATAGAIVKVLAFNAGCGNSGDTSMISYPHLLELTRKADREAGQSNMRII